MSYLPLIRHINLRFVTKLAKIILPMQKGKERPLVSDYVWANASSCRPWCSQARRWWARTMSVAENHQQLFSSSQTALTSRSLKNRIDFLLICMCMAFYKWWNMVREECKLWKRNSIFEFWFAIFYLSRKSTINMLDNNFTNIFIIILSYRCLFTTPTTMRQIID